METGRHRRHAHQKQVVEIPVQRDITHIVIQDLQLKDILCCIRIKHLGLNGWRCYYQKASLARQSGDWEELGRLYKEVNALKLNTSDKSEMIPFFEGLVNLGQYDDARSLYRKQIRGSPEVRLSVCEALEKDPEYPPEYGYDYEMVNQILCEE